MSLRPKKGCVAVSILGVQTPLTSYPIIIQLYIHLDYHDMGVCLGNITREVIL